MSRGSAVLLPVVILLIACGGDTQNTAETTTTSTAPATQTAAARTPASSNVDLPFIDAMQKHHEQAVQMAKVAAERATDPKIRSMAAKMVDDQQEIAQLTTWREQWFAGAPPADTAKIAGSSPMNMGMSHMQSLTGHQFDMMFVDMMVPHHEGAIAMSCDAHTRSTRDEIKKFARGVVRAQEKEISDLTAWKQSMAM